MNSINILLAFGAYLLVMLIIGIVYYKKTKSSDDYFLGGRSLNGWVAALSAQASDMSGWLLMGLPGSIYALGTGQIWIAVGLAVGTILNWSLVSGRLRKYTIVSGDSLTLPAFFENRYKDKTKILRIASSVFIMVFFLVYTASAFSAGAKLFSAVFNIEYTAALAIGAAVILCYTFLGGFMAVCWTDFIQGFMMLISLMVVPTLVISMIGGTDETMRVLNEVSPTFLNPLYNGSEKMTTIDYISQLGWALGYFGMPHILIRFMAIRDAKEVKKSRVIGIVWVLISLSTAIFVGAVGRAFLGDSLGADSENVFIQMILKVFSGNSLMIFIGGVLLCGILAAIMSTADSQLLVTASAISEDLYKGVIHKKASDKSMLLVSRITVLAVAAIAFFIALDPNSSVMGLVSNAWAGFGACFGPVILLSLFWKRANLPGAASGMIAGGGTVLLWDYVKFSGATLGEATGLYSLVPGFVLGTLVIVVVSLLTKKPGKEVTDEFERVQKNAF